MLNRDVCLKCHLEYLSNFSDNQKKLGRDLFFLDWKKGRVCCMGFERVLPEAKDIDEFNSSMIKIDGQIPKFCKHIEEQNVQVGD